MNNNWFIPKGSGGVEANAQRQETAAQQQADALKWQQSVQENAYQRYLGSLSGTDSAAQSLLMRQTSKARANTTPFMPTNYSSQVKTPFQPTNAPTYTNQNYASKVGNAPTYTNQNYAGQIASPQTNYATQVNAKSPGTWSAPSGSQYTLSPEVLAKITSGATPEDIQKQVQQAYGTLNDINLQQYGNTAKNALAAEMARRGITDSSGALSSRIGLGNALTTQGAQMNAQGILAGIQAAEEARNARNSALLSGEGLKQQAAASALGVGTTVEQVRASRAAEELAALQAASGLQQNYVSGVNDAAALRQQLNTGEFNNQLNAYNAGLAGLQTQSGLTSQELQRQVDAYNTALNGNLAYTSAANQALEQQAALAQQAYQNAVTDYGLEQANSMYEDQARAAYLQYLQNQQNQYLGMVNPGAMSSGYANLGQTYGNIGNQYAQIGANQMNLLGSLAGTAGSIYGMKGG